MTIFVITCISVGAFYNWRGRYVGMEVIEPKRMKELESNALKRILAEKLLEVEALKDAMLNKW